MLDPLSRYCKDCIWFSPTDNGLGVCKKLSKVTGYFLEVDAHDFCSKGTPAYSISIGDLNGTPTYSSSTGDLRGIFIEKENTMDEKDKIIQDLRRENEKLHEENEKILEGLRKLVYSLRGE